MEWSHLLIPVEFNMSALSGYIEFFRGIPINSCRDDECIPFPKKTYFFSLSSNSNKRFKKASSTPSPVSALVS